MQAGKIADVLILLMLANGAPLVAKQLLADYRCYPLDGREGHAFDATPVSERPRRLLALDPSLLAFGAMPQSPEAAGFRPIPAWHSVRDAECVGGTIGVLARARELIADEQRWCRRSFARGWAGIPVSAKSTIAQRFCALGAIMRAAHELRVPAEDARTALEWQTIRPIQDWNDDPARRHAEVIAKFDAAIAAVGSSAA